MKFWMSPGVLTNLFIYLDLCRCDSTGGAKMSRNRVLIPLDGSSFSERILPIVRRFLQPAENELILFQVTEPPDGGTGAISDLVADDVMQDRIIPRLSPAQMEMAQHPTYTSQVEDSVAVDLEAKLSPLVTELRNNGYAVSTLVEFGDPAPGIEQAIRDHHIDLVAMTTHGRTGLRRALLGSVAEHVLRHASVPLLLLHPFDNGSSV
jgi:nucleotide-binding universal stress UspA family protein